MSNFHSERIRELDQLTVNDSALYLIYSVCQCCWQEAWTMYLVGHELADSVLLCKDCLYKIEDKFDRELYRMNHGQTT